jgi:hypothetical protein
MKCPLASFFGRASLCLGILAAGAARAELYDWPDEAVMPAAAEEVDALAEQPAAAVDHRHCGTCCKPKSCCKCLCGPSGRFWIRGEYLLWWTKGDSLPPLVTTSPTGTPRPQAGVLGQPGTVILFGDEDVNDGARSGGRFTVGTWLDDCQTWGIEGDYFALGEEVTEFSASSLGDPILARPFFNVITGQQDSELVAFPGIVTGSVNVRASSDFQGAGARLLHSICCRTSCGHKICNRNCHRLDLIAGYRFLKLDEDVVIGEQLISTDPAGLIPLGTQIDLTDRFHTRNEFHGGELGLLSRIYRGRWSFDVLGKVALGGTWSTVTIDGATTVTVPGVAPASRGGGLLAQGSNIGTFSEENFAVVPEVGLTLGYFVRPRLRALMGYTFIYWSHVARPGDQIDVALNPLQLTPGPFIGPERPAFEFRDSDFWAQGLNFGLEYTF